MKATTVLLIILQTAWALAKVDTQIHEIDGVTAVESINLPDEMNGLDDLPTQLGCNPNFTFVPVRSRRLCNGMIREKLHLYYKHVFVRGYPLQITRSRLHIPAYRKYVSGYLPTIDDLDVDPENMPSPGEVKQIMVDFTKSLTTTPGLEDLEIKKKDIKNFYCEKQIYIIPETGEAVLVLFAKGLIDLLEDQSFIRFPRMIISIKDRVVLKGTVFPRYRRSSYLQGCPVVTGGNDKLEGQVYGLPPDKCLHTAVRRQTCIFKNDVVEVWDSRNTWERSKGELVKFPCDEGPNDAINGANSPSADAFYFGTQFCRMMKTIGAQEVCEGPKPLRMHVHYGQNYGNSLFDGFSVTFGDGTNTRFPFAVPELIGHEMCHVWTDNLGNLNFDDESLTWDEALADICGKALSIFNGAANDWTFAANAIKEEGKALRYFDDPKLAVNSIDHYDDYDPEVIPPFRALGIITKAFYLMVNDYGMKFSDVFEAFVFANEIYFHEDTNLLDGACDVLRAAADLRLKTRWVRRAFRQTGLILDFCSLKGTGYTGN